MGTKIDYLTDTWNPIAMRCDRVSPGCANCWHLRMCPRHAANKKLAPELRVARAGGLFALMQDVLQQPLHWKKPRTVGVQYMGDLFHEKVRDEWITAVLRAIAGNPRHTFLALTKRIERVRESLSGAVIPNLWLGVTAENQEWADKRIQVLLQIPAAVRFVSLEPLLGPVNVSPWLEHFIHPRDRLRHSKAGVGPWSMPWLDWVIVGCESGPKRRECKLEWVQSIVRQCREAGVPVFVKQVSFEGKVYHKAEDVARILLTDVSQIRQFPAVK